MQRNRYRWSFKPGGMFFSSLVMCGMILLAFPGLTRADSTAQMVQRKSWEEQKLDDLQEKQEYIRKRLEDLKEQGIESEEATKERRKLSAILQGLQKEAQRTEERISSLRKKIENQTNRGNLPDTYQAKRILYSEALGPVKKRIVQTLNVGFRILPGLDLGQDVRAVMFRDESPSPFANDDRWREMNERSPVETIEQSLRAKHK